VAGCRQCDQRLRRPALESDQRLELRCLTRFVEQFSGLELAPEQKQRAPQQVFERQRFSACQRVSSLHDSQDTGREKRLALQPAGAPQSDG
jgi:hypothetical protein